MEDEETTKTGGAEREKARKEKKSEQEKGLMRKRM